MKLEVIRMSSCLVQTRLFQSLDKVGGVFHGHIEMCSWLDVIGGEITPILGSMHVQNELTSNQSSASFSYLHVSCGEMQQLLEFRSLSSYCGYSC